MKVNFQTEKELLSEIPSEITEEIRNFKQNNPETIGQNFSSVLNARKKKRSFLPNFSPVIRNRTKNFTSKLTIHEFLEYNERVKKLWEEFKRIHKRNRDEKVVRLSNSGNVLDIVPPIFFLRHFDITDGDALSKVIKIERVGYKSMLKKKRMNPSPQKEGRTKKRTERRPSETILTYYLDLVEEKLSQEILHKYDKYFSIFQRVQVLKEDISQFLLAMNKFKNSLQHFKHSNIELPIRIVSLKRKHNQMQVIEKKLKVLQKLNRNEDVIRSILENNGIVKSSESKKMEIKKISVSVLDAVILMNENEKIIRAESLLGIKAVYNRWMRYGRFKERVTKTVLKRFLELVIYEVKELKKNLSIFSSKKKVPKEEVDLKFDILGSSEVEIYLHQLVVTGNFSVTVNEFKKNILKFLQWKAKDELSAIFTKLPPNSLTRIEEFPLSNNDKEEKGNDQSEPITPVTPGVLLNMNGLTFDGLLFVFSTYSTRLLSVLDRCKSVYELFLHFDRHFNSPLVSAGVKKVNKVGEPLLQSIFKGLCGIVHSKFCAVVNKRTLWATVTPIVSKESREDVTELTSAFSIDQMKKVEDVIMNFMKSTEKKFPFLAEDSRQLFKTTMKKIYANFQLHYHVQSSNSVKNEVDKEKWIMANSSSQKKFEKIGKKMEKFFGENEKQLGSRNYSRSFLSVNVTLFPCTVGLLGVYDVFFRYLNLFNIEWIDKVEATKKLKELIGVYNSETMDYILGAQAVNRKRLKSINAKHLILTSECLNSVVFLLPLIIRFIVNRLEKKQQGVLNSFDPLIRDLNSHRSQIYDKLFDIIKSFLVEKTKKWTVKNWDSLPSKMEEISMESITLDERRIVSKTKASPEIIDLLNVVNFVYEKVFVVYISTHPNVFRVQFTRILAFSCETLAAGITNLKSVTKSKSLIQIARDLYYYRTAVLNFSEDFRKKFKIKVLLKDVPFAKIEGSFQKKFQKSIKIEI